MKKNGVIHTFLGDLILTEEDGFITAVDFGSGELKLEMKMEKPTTLMLLAKKQLEEFSEGKRDQFTLPLHPEGTPFQKKVWAVLLTIPKGETRSYQEVAKLCGNEKASRAVGMANNRNPIPIFIPCHRVIGKNGALVGYGGGLPIKEALLRLEGSLL
ncbi:methylated-DNA--[protein]-cysteine S-methyltransferase [Proteiniclasticum ruminis]|uniref:Methylated-DNA--protein-cysteine methyltransferase n=1 Tax=Proteiniclasticum ruminis TaxID=398199 RepID=A0A1I4XQB7_9CLOT|nr:methylated-DNA--[protein]-cysteine S-methyltransferase [Proteiniclasticum ruminis]SFN27449.1 methylated-DNA-[protein]-cysteine S-methyltransferase [Proteiniclasticum ruminis]